MLEFGLKISLRGGRRFDLILLFFSELDDFIRDSQNQGIKHDVTSEYVRELALFSSIAAFPPKVLSRLYYTNTLSCLTWVDFYLRSTCCQKDAL